MLTLHKIPEGMAVSAPLIAGGIKKWKAVLWTCLCGATMIIGGVMGVLVGRISPNAIALSLSAAGGAMLYIVFCEMLPQSIVMTKDRKPALVALIGVLVGLIATQIA
jgi:ZIP family zinc transporter